MGQAFRNDPQLQQFVLTDVTPTGTAPGNWLLWFSGGGESSSLP